MTSNERKSARYQRRKEKRDKKREDIITPLDDFTILTDPNVLYSAFRSCRKGVSWKESTQRYEMSLFNNISDTIERLENGKEIHHGFVEFDLNERGKKRHIKSIHISERVVQKALCDQILVPILCRTLIYDNGASVKNKGIHFAIKRLITHLAKYYRQNNYSNEGYALTIDFRKYFDSIKHDILMERVRKYIKDERIIDLIWQFIKPFGDNVSLGLGSQVSQVFAIFHCNELDHAIKEKMRIKYYGRYMDDLYLIHKDKKFLEECLEKIKVICETLGITVNERKTRIFPLSDGLLFLKGKYFLQANGKIYKKPTKESAKRMRRKLKCFKSLVTEGRMDYQDIRVAFQSWRGNFTRRFHAYKKVKFMDNFYDNLFIHEHPKNT
ncbi:MAG: reverse transcriptase domain-containing protein [Treponema sp.]|nr:reverse transcriptase domain-containing protein [Treponema sp.]